MGIRTQGHLTIMQRLTRFCKLDTFRSVLLDPTQYLKPIAIGCIRKYPGDELGRGAGKGGGKGGAVRDAGGPLGKREAALEEEYFHRKEKEALKKLREHLKAEIKNHYEAIERAKDKLEDLDELNEKK